MQGGTLSPQEAREIIETPHEDVFHLISAANDVRRHFKGDMVDLCVIVNTKSGACTEDCAFCAQSAHHGTDAPVYPLMGKQEILKRARAAEAMGGNKLCFVTSGRGVESEDDLASICDAISAIAEQTSLDRCGSLGSLDHRQLKRLREAGLQSLHHNIETAESFFEHICTTHTYEDRIRTVRAAKELGFYVCCGGIFGMGESPQQRVEMALALRELDIDSVPLNFLNPIRGTRLEHAELLHPLDILKIIALFRFILPEKDIRACGGRERNLRSLQPLMYLAGANCTVIGNYLTTQGRDYKEDLEMIADLGLGVNLGGTLSPGTTSEAHKRTSGIL
ncbi:MAG: biotin synthase BioB [Candidatus Abyssobacteria bacterium SURF_17]|uniref:Biotin synthase n=1 Tax=Candidatus Abyssobacteria bacterium SURF_17 TaxID=2093361 RepID=A0A419ETG5_9BACT|nr:MAG: biotin synthase BioB [Candidatus Abyssubacteria bacterium SURF_17]